MLLVRPSTTPRLACVPLVALLALAACDDFDGGLVPIGKLPDPTFPATTDTSGETTAPGVTITSPADGATVDADWIPVALDVTGFTLDATHAVAVTVITADAEPVTTLVRAPSAVLKRVPAGALTIRATLVEGTTPLDVSAEVDVTATRVAPTVTITTPSEGTALPTSAAGVEVVVALTDFTLLAGGASPSGPRQGFLELAVDDVATPPIGTTTATLTLPAVGPHVLTARLVDADGVPWSVTATDSVAFVVGAAPAVTILTPEADSTVEGARLGIALAIDDFITDGYDTPGHGTFAVSLDGQQVLTKRTGSEAVLSGLPAGAHTLLVELTTATGAPLDPPARASVAFDSVLLPPSLEIVLPTGTTTKAGLQRVAVVPRHFTFTTQTIPGPLVPATGAWQLLVDDVVVDDLVQTAQTEVQLQPGTRKLTARLVDAAGAVLVPSVEATRTLDVRALATSVQILTPAMGATVAKRFPVAVAFEDFTLSDELLGPGAPVVPGVGHFHAFLRKVPATTYEYQGFFLTESFELQVPDAGTWDLKVALHYQNHDPVVPAVEAEVRFEVDARSGIRLMSPLAGARIGPEPFAVAVQVDNFELIPIGEVSTVKGHYHLFVDGNYQGFFLTPFAVLDPKTMTPPLTKGGHTMTAFLHNSNHDPIPGTISDSVAFTHDDQPAVRFVSPAAGSKLATDPFVVEVEVDDLRIVDKAGQANVPGEGHLHVFVDNDYIDFETSERFTLAIDEAGAHTVKVTLHENDHTAIAGAAPAFLSVVVDDTPRVVFVAPADGTFTYGGDLDVMLDPDNHAGDVEVTVDDVVVYVGPPDAVDVPPLGEGAHEARAVPVDATGEPIAGAPVSVTRFEVVGLEPPTVTWVAPAANATVVAGQEVTIGVSGFTLEDDAARRPGVPGDGLWTLSVGERVYGPFTTPTVALPALPRGATTLVAELWHRDGSRVMPRRTASLAVDVGGTTPAVSLRSPSDSGSWYGPTIDVAVDVADFALGPTTGWLVVRVDGLPVAVVARPRATVGPFTPGLHALEVELVGADRASLAPPVKATRKFRVGGTTLPSVSINTPADGATLSGNGTAISFSVGGLTFDPAATGGRALPGHGAVLVYVDGRVEAIATGSPVTVTGLGSGRHRIELVLAGLDLVPLHPLTADAIDVTVP